MAKADDDTITAWEFASEARDRLAKHTEDARLPRISLGKD
jgi:hypothetical protein